MQYGEYLSCFVSLSAAQLTLLLNKWRINHNWKANQLVLIVYVVLFNHEPLAFSWCHYPKSSICFKLSTCLHYLAVWHMNEWTFSTQHWLPFKRFSLFFFVISFNIWVGGGLLSCLSLFLFGCKCNTWIEHFHEQTGVEKNTKQCHLHCLFIGIMNVAFPGNCSLTDNVRCLQLYLNVFLLWKKNSPRNALSELGEQFFYSCR